MAMLNNQMVYIYSIYEGIVCIYIHTYIYTYIYIYTHIYNFANFAPATEISTCHLYWDPRYPDLKLLQEPSLGAGLPCKDDMDDMLGIFPKNMCIFGDIWNIWKYVYFLGNVILHSTSGSFHFVSSLWNVVLFTEVSGFSNKKSGSAPDEHQAVGGWSREKLGNQAWTCR